MTNQINNQSTIPSTDVIRLALTLKMTTSQVVEMSVTVNNNSPIQDYVHPDDQTQPTFETTPGFKPFTIADVFCSLDRENFYHHHPIDAFRWPQGPMYPS